MDTLTHIALGACIGELIAGRQLGKKALLIGAIAQNIPDIDIVASAWLPVCSDVLAHRGFTHSFLFTILITPLLAAASRKWLGKALSFKQWAIFWGLQIFIHQFIDAFNAYGTGWFVPFSKYRVSFNTLYVADPLFILGPAIACIALIVLRRTNRHRVQWARAGLTICTLYLLCSIVFKLYINNDVKKELTNKNITYTSYFSTPTPLNNLLWYIVAATDSGYYTGYRSVLDSKAAISFRYIPRNDSLLRYAVNKTDLAHLLQFSKGYYTTEKWHDTVVFNDMRFGEVNGWTNQHPHFAFYYFLQYPGDNDMIVQRGRFTGWDRQTLHAFFKRIGGN